MAIQGRPTKPVELKLLAGNPGNRPLPSTVLKSDQPLGNAPRHFTKEQKSDWRHAAKYAPQGLLTVMDRSILMIWIVANDYYRQAKEQVELTGLFQTTPKGFEMPSAAITLMRGQAEVMMRAQSELGFTPSSRSRVAPSAPASTGGSKFDGLSAV